MSLVEDLVVQEYRISLMVLIFLSELISMIIECIWWSDSNVGIWKEMRNCKICD